VVLRLTRYRGILPLGISSHELAGYDGPGLDISCLTILATNLPRLKALFISVLAGNTSKLCVEDGDAHLPTFGKLSRLRFESSSFLNWRRKGFDEYEAANFIVSLLPPLERCTVDVYTEGWNDTTGFDADDLNWPAVKREYVEFIKGFERRLKEYAGVRYRQAGRMMRLLKSQLNTPSLPASQPTASTSSSVAVNEDVKVKVET